MAQRGRAGKTYEIDKRVAEVRVSVEWSSSSEAICDLDLMVLVLDERAKLVEKIDLRNPISHDQAVRLTADVDIKANYKATEFVVVQLESVSADTAALLYYLDGGSRNFHRATSVKATLTRTRVIADAQSMHSAEDGKELKLSVSTYKPTEATGCVALGVLFQHDGVWTVHHLLQQLGDISPAEQLLELQAMVVNVIPHFEQFKPRLFPTVASICAALSSHSLPELKEPFLRSKGLNKDQFTRVLFRQLVATNPGLVNHVEASYCVAMLHEMFSQIDFNDDTTVDWEEFTSFTIQTGLINTRQSDERGLDDFILEYEQDLAFATERLTSHKAITCLRYHRGTQKVMTINDEQLAIRIFDRNGHPIGSIVPEDITPGAPDHPALQHANFGRSSSAAPKDLNGRLRVHDVLFIDEFDAYVYTTSDHSINVCKEHTTFRGQRSYTHVKRMFDTCLHTKLAWSTVVRLLCSVAGDHSIHGWDLEAGEKVFHIRRHDDVVTKLLPIDELELVASCSMDKRIALWDMRTRRVRAVLTGHKCGVRDISYGKGVLLSAGFELDATTWDVSTRERLVTLRGHRLPICAVHVLCENMPSDESLRALTLDDSGEFRLWDIYVKERKSSMVTFAPLLQTFSLQTVQPPLNRLRHFACPYDPAQSLEQYSDIIAGSCLLYKFRPERLLKEFVSPTAMTINTSANTIVTAVGRRLFIYDICTGAFLRSIGTVSHAEVTAVCFDLPSQRRLFVGCHNSEVHVLNYTTGARICSIRAHTAEINCILYQPNPQRSYIFSSAIDGSLVSYDECQGTMSVYQSVPHLFGPGKSIQDLKVSREMEWLLACSNDCEWGIWDYTNLRKLAVVTDPDGLKLSDLCLVPSELWPTDPVPVTDMYLPQKLHRTASYIIVAVATVLGPVRIYLVSMLAFVPVLVQKLAIAESVHFAGTNRTTDIDAIRLAVESRALQSAGDRRRQRVAQQTGSTNHGNNANGDDRDKAANNGVRKLGGIVSLGYNCIPAHAKANFMGSRSELAVKHCSSDKAWHGLVACTDEGWIAVWDLEAPLLQAFERYKQHTVMSGSRPSFRSPIARPSMFLTETLSTPQRKRLTSTSNASAFSNRTGNTSDDDDDGENRNNDSDDKDDDDDDDDDEDAMIESTPSVLWRGHVDAIAAVIHLRGQGCLLTLSHDGFHRLWNLAGDILGEMPLPNLTEQMKDMRNRPVQIKVWKFLLDRIVVCEAHEEFARQLLQEMAEAGLLDEQADTVSTLLQTSPAAPRRQLPSYSRMISTAGSRHESMLDSIRQNTPSLFEKQPCFVDSRALGPSVMADPAFSEKSIFEASKKGQIDTNALKILRRISMSEDKVQVYDRLYPNLLLRHIPSTTSVVLPKVTQETKPELLLGTQTGYYKHATGYARQQLHISVSKARHVMTLDRINGAVSRVGDLTALDSAGGKEGVGLEATEGLDSPPRHSASQSTVQTPIHCNARKVRTAPTRASTPGFASPMSKAAQQRTAQTALGRMRRASVQMREQVDQIVMSLNSTQEPADSQDQRPNSRLDTTRLAGFISRMDEAIAFPDSNINIKQQSNARRHLATKQGGGDIVHAARTTSIIHQLEIKLASSLRLAANLWPTSTFAELKPTAFAPYYRIEDVIKFKDGFNQVDEELSGHLGLTEWVMFFHLTSSSVHENESFRLFNQLDINGDGLVSMEELVSVVFSNASYEQQKLMLAVTEAENMRSYMQSGLRATAEAIRTLFGLYDQDHMGYIPAGVIKEKFMGLQIPDSLAHALIATLDCNDDHEMINAEEFEVVLRRHMDKG